MVEASVTKCRPPGTAGFDCHSKQSPSCSCNAIVVQNRTDRRCRSSLFPVQSIRLESAWVPCMSQSVYTSPLAPSRCPSRRRDTCSRLALTCSPNGRSKWRAFPSSTDRLHRPCPRWTGIHCPHGEDWGTVWCKGAACIPPTVRSRRKYSPCRSIRSHNRRWFWPLFDCPATWWWPHHFPLE